MCRNKGTMKHPSSAVRRKYPKSKQHRILKLQNHYPRLIKSPKPTQSNAWRSNSVTNTKETNYPSKAKAFECMGLIQSNLSVDVETNPGPVINSTKKNSSSLQSRQCGNVWVNCWYTVCSRLYQDKIIIPFF